MTRPVSALPAASGPAIPPGSLGPDAKRGWRPERLPARIRPSAAIASRLSVRGRSQAAPGDKGADSGEPGRSDPPPPDLAAILCAMVKVAVEGVADLRPAPLRGTIERTPRGLQRRGQLAMYLAHVGFGVRTSDVARAFGRDTTTVYHAYRQVEDMRDDPGIDAFLDAVEAIVTRVYAIAERREDPATVAVERAEGKDAGSTGSEGAPRLPSGPASGGRVPMGRR